MIKNLLFFLFTLPVASKANIAFAKENCFSENYYRYCVYKASQGNNGDIAYYFHGKSGNADSWGKDNDFAQPIHKYWSDKKIKPPLIVSISFGGEWLLTPKLSSPESGLLEKLTINVIPKIEGTLFKPRKRIILGKSMGGLNALIAGLSQKELFKKVAALCAGVYPVPMYKLSEPVKNFALATKTDLKVIEDFIALTKNYVNSDTEWETISPLKIIDRLSGNGSDLYLWAGRNDKHPNYLAVEDFASF
jgi:enterochelin esterase-like enzyme